MKIPQLQTLCIQTSNDSLEGLHILHVSDIHINKKTSFATLEALVKICNESIADFIVITGDIIDCKVEKIKDKLQLLNQIKKKTYYVSGNHDLFYGIDKLKEVLCFTFLDNTHAIFQFKKHEITIAGLGDRFSKYFRKTRDEKRVVQQLYHAKNSILLAHQPKDYLYALESNANLFLCGHTHGGQIYPFHYLVRLFQPFVAGIFYKKNTSIYVNKGLGYWGIDIRFRAKSEITLLKLIPKSVES